MSAIPVTSGLQLLLDARTITGLSDGDPLSVTWSDQSGQGNHAAQATAANRPIYKTNIFGSNPAVRTVDSSDFVHGTFASWGTHAGSTVLMCASNLPASQTVSGRFLATTAAGQHDVNNMIVADQSATLQCWVNGANRFQLMLGLASAGSPQPVIFGAAFGATLLDEIVNGVWRGGYAHGTSLPSSPTVYSTGYINAGTPSTGYSCLADYHFIAVFNRRLSGVEIEQMSGWMRSELGMITATSATKPQHPMSQQVIG